MAPLDELTTPCIDYLKSICSKSKTVSEIIDSKDPLVYTAIEKGFIKN